VINRFRVTQALKSFGSLGVVVNDLTEEEVLACLDLEAATSRRRSVLNRLMSRAVRLNEISYQRQLKEKYSWHVNPQPPKS
jgi:hypothetical protein